MKLITSFAALALLQIAAGHSVFTTLFVDDVNQGDGTCVRMPMNQSDPTAPLIDLTSNDMACGKTGSAGVATVCPISQSSKLTFVWREFADASAPGAIDISHKGPCAVYMKAVSSAITDVGYGSGWFKIWESGYDSTTNKWCTETLIENNGLFSVNVPASLAGGSYLIRPELLSLHEADKTPAQPQFYTGCAQVFLTSSGTSLPSNTVSIPGYVKAADASVNFNIYTPVWPYSLPGPAVFTSSSASTIMTVSSTTQTEGLEPANSVLKNANWYGIELDSYSTENGCWSAGSACWAECTTCYNTAPPTGSANCKIWEDKCTAINNACSAGNFNGPPNKGLNLNPTSSITYAIPAVVGGAAASEPSGATSVAIVATVSPIVATATSTIVEATPVSDDSDDSDDSSEDEAQVTNSPAVISQPAQTTFATVVSKAYTRNSNHRHHRHGSRTSKPTATPA